jgi:3-deoxy-D-manno-octulosonic-acid transferase
VPLDEPRHVEAVLDVVAPSLLAFARGDLWPELVARATQRNIPVVAFGASVRPGSLRLRLPTRSLYAELLERVSWIGAATPEDAARCRRMGAADSIVDMTGDPRHDEVIERIPDIAPLHSLLAWASDRPVLVAGSLEPSDESILAAAAGQVLGDVPNAGVMLVPHDPSHASLHRLRRRTTDANLDAAVWTPGEGMPRSRCVIVGARGLLFDSYALGALAYVGGGFRRNRLHAVIEPAAYALPVLVGPQWAASADASALVTAGGAIPLPAREPQLALASVWSEWLRDPTRRSSIGLLARGTVTHGAAKVTVDRLVSLMG